MSKPIENHPTTNGALVLSDDIDSKNATDMLKEIPSQTQPAQTLGSVFTPFLKLVLTGVVVMLIVKKLMK